MPSPNRNFVVQFLLDMLATFIPINDIGFRQVPPIACAQTVGYQLATSFIVHGTISLLPDPSDHSGSLPMDLVWILNNGGSKRVLRSLADLDGSVSIRNQVEALDFVRLRTSPATMLFEGKDRIFEIIQRDKLNLAFVFGHREMLKALRASSIGTTGLVDESWLRTTGIRKARTIKVASGWKIFRPILYHPSGKKDRFYVRLETEFVSPRGEYSLLSSVPIAVKPPKSGWSDFLNPL